MSAVEAPEVIEVTLRSFGNGTFLLSLQFNQQVSLSAYMVQTVYGKRQIIVKINVLLWHLEYTYWNCCVLFYIITALGYLKQQLQ